MRIVHEIKGKATVSAGFRPYAIAIGRKKSTGVIVDLLIIVEEHGIIPSEEIHIEGDGAYFLDVLESAVKMIKSTTALMVEKGHIIEDWSDLEAKGTRLKKDKKKS